MGWRYRKSISLGGGSRMNLSGSGVSFSQRFGNTTINRGPRGTWVTTSIPGTGLSHRYKAKDDDPFVRGATAGQAVFNLLVLGLAAVGFVLWALDKLFR